MLGQSVGRFALLLSLLPFLALSCPLFDSSFGRLLDALPFLNLVAELLRSLVTTEFLLADQFELVAVAAEFLSYPAGLLRLLFGDLDHLEALGKVAE